MIQLYRRRIPDLVTGQPALVTQPDRGYMFIEALIRYPNLVSGIFLRGTWDNNLGRRTVPGSCVTVSNGDPSQRVFALSWDKDLPPSVDETPFSQQCNAMWAEINRAHPLGRKLPTAPKAEGQG